VTPISLVPRDRVFFDLFVEAGENALRSARFLQEMLEKWPDDPGGLARDVLKSEQEGDRITHDIVQRLNTTFVTPIDREDIYGLATKLDDIVDYVEEAADFLGLYQIEAPMEQAQAMADVLVRSCEQLSGALGDLRGSRTSTTTGSRSTGWRTTATGSRATPSPRCSRTGSTRWS
jgi:uncharacterized protein